MKKILIIGLMAACFAGMLFLPVIAAADDCVGPGCIAPEPIPNEIEGKAQIADIYSHGDEATGGDACMYTYSAYKGNDAPAQGSAGVKGTLTGGTDPTNPFPNAYSAFDVTASATKETGSLKLNVHGEFDQVSRATYIGPFEKNWAEAFSRSGGMFNGEKTAAPDGLDTGTGAASGNGYSLVYSDSTPERESVGGETFSTVTTGLYNIDGTQKQYVQGGLNGQAVKESDTGYSLGQFKAVFDIRSSGPGTLSGHAYGGADAIETRTGNSIYREANSNSGISFNKSP